MRRPALFFLLIGSLLQLCLSETDDIVSFDLRNISYWRSLSPKLHVYDAEFLQQQGTFPESAIDQHYVVDRVLNEGYVQLEPLAWQLPLQDMVDVIEKLHELHIPITFCFMYDEFWYMFMRLHITLQHILGSDYKRLPDFWAWRVDPKQSERGWHVHRDKNFETLYTSGMPKTLSVWIPLTDATTSNGCMYVLPADRDPTYRRQDLLGPHFEELASDLRALPIQAGGALIWNQVVWHWGSRSNRRGTQPRYSLAVEFQAAPTAPVEAPTTGDAGAAAAAAAGTGRGGDAVDTEQLERARAWNDVGNAADSDLYGDTVRAYNTPLTNPMLLFSFEDRLVMVAKQILQYSHMYPLSAQVSQLAQLIIYELGERV